MKKVIKISIIVLIILMLAIGGVFAYLYFGTDIFRTDKQMLLKYASESKDFIYNQLKDEDLDAYKTKLKNTPYENNGKISISYDTENSNKTAEMKHIENSNISISGKVDKANKINLQNIKLNYPQSKSIDIDILAQDDMYGFRINNILKRYIVIENNNLQEWAKELGLNEELINLIPNKIDSNLIDSIISEDEVNQLVEKYSKLIINSLNDDMFSKANQESITIYSLKINETQLKNIAKNVLETAKEDEVIWQVIRKVFTSFSIYSEEEVDNKIDELKSELEEYINNYGEDYTAEDYTAEDYNAEDYTGEDYTGEDYNADDYTAENEKDEDITVEDDIYGNITTDISKEDKIYVYNLYIEDKELIKIESVNDDESQIISKTENGILIEKKEKDYNDQEDITTMTIEKKKEEDKLIYNIEMSDNSKLIGSMSIGYRGLESLNQVEEVAVLNFNLDEELDNGILKRAQDARKVTMSAEEKEEIMISVSDILAEKYTEKFNNNNDNIDINITLNDLKQKLMDKNFEFFENEDETFKIISKDTNNEYTVTSNGEVETKEAEIQENIETKNPKRKIQYFNKNVFNENFQIKRIEDDEIWKMNGKDAKQIKSVFDNISIKMEDINKEQMQNITPYEQTLISNISIFSLVPYLSIVGIDNIEYDQLNTKNIISFYSGAAAVLMGINNYTIYNTALNVMNNTNLE